jgi:hypothetical protein
VSDERRNLAVRAPERDILVDPEREVGDADLDGGVRPALCLVEEKRYIQYTYVARMIKREMITYPITVG